MCSKDLVSDGYTDQFNLYTMYMPLMFQCMDVVTQLLASISSGSIYRKPKLEKQMVKFEILSAHMNAPMMWQIRSQESVGGRLGSKATVYCAAAC